MLSIRFVAILILILFYLLFCSIPLLAGSVSWDTEDDTNQDAVVYPVNTTTPIPIDYSTILHTYISLLFFCLLFPFHILLPLLFFIVIYQYHIAADTYTYTYTYILLLSLNYIYILFLFFNLYYMMI